MTGFKSKKASAQDKLTQWLEALHHSQEPESVDAQKAIADMGQALAQPVQEPVCPACKAEVLYECVACSSNNYPPQRKPLTDEQRQELMSKAWNEWLSRKDDGRLFAWSFSFEVEAAHGIKEKT
jgi:hypothetical protein